MEVIEIHPNREDTFLAGRELDTPWPGSDLRNFQNLTVRSRPGKFFFLIGISCSFMENPQMLRLTEIFKRLSRSAATPCATWYAALKSMGTRVSKLES